MSIDVLIFFGWQIKGKQNELSKLFKCRNWTHYPLSDQGILKLFYWSQKSTSIFHWHTGKNDDIFVLVVFKYFLPLEKKVAKHKNWAEKISNLGNSMRLVPFCLKSCSLSSHLSDFEV